MNSVRLLAGMAAALFAGSAHASVEISSAPTMNMNCSAGVCIPTAKSAVLNVNDLTAMLSSSDITVKSGNSAVTIGIVSPFAWASTHRLTLDAQLNVNIKAQVMVEGTAGLTIVTNDGGTGGDLMFYPGGKIDFWDTNSSLDINGGSYVLVNDIASLASGIANNASGLYAFANDYDASADGMYKHSPILTHFAGALEGLGHTISNLSIEGDGYAALFKIVSGTLRDTGLRNVDVVSSGYAASLLAEDDAATIIGCYATGSVLGAGAAGGLVGGSTSAGGAIARSRAAVGVKTGNPAGGLVGISLSNISLSSASGPVVSRSSGVDPVAGGLVGYLGDTASISQSFETGRVMAGQYGKVGGLVGETNMGSSIQDSYTTGGARGRGAENLGGLAGVIENSSVVHSSYSIGDVKRGGFKHADRGGFVASAGSEDDFKWDYWDIDTSGWTKGYGSCQDNNCAAIKGLHTGKFRSGLPAGFDPKIWGQSASINNGYPYLIANPPQ